MTAFTTENRDGYRTAISSGDPDICIDPFPYTVRDVALGLSRLGWIFNLVDVLTTKDAVAPVSVFMCLV